MVPVSSSLFFFSLVCLLGKITSWPPYVGSAGFFWNFIVPWNSILEITAKCSAVCFLQAWTSAYRKQWRAHTRPSMWHWWREKLGWAASDLGCSLSRVKASQWASELSPTRGNYTGPWLDLQERPLLKSSGGHLLYPAAQGHSWHSKLELTK